MKGAGSIAPPMAAIPGNICKGHGLPEGILGRIGVTVSGADSDRVYAIIEAKGRRHL